MSIFFCCDQKTSFTVETNDVSLQVEEVATGIAVPFAIDFLPDGSMLVTNRSPAQLLLVDVETGTKSVIEDGPEVLADGDGGMLDVRVHPEYAVNGWIYFSYSIRLDSVSTLVVERGKLKGLRLIKRETLFTALPYYKEPNHFGSRLLLTKGYLYITMGERYYLRDSAQSLTNHLGKIIRLHDDGTIPVDNPFVHKKKCPSGDLEFGASESSGTSLSP